MLVSVKLFLKNIFLFLFVWKMIFEKMLTKYVFEFTINENIYSGGFKF